MARVRRGELATVREIEIVTSLPRQTIARWLREEGLDLGKMRMRRLAKLHEQEERYLAGLPAKRKPSKRLLRWIATKAKRQWDETHAEPEGIPQDRG